MERWKLFRLQGSKAFAPPRSTGAVGAARTLAPVSVKGAIALLLGLLLWMHAVPASSVSAEDISAEDPILEAADQPARTASIPPLPFNGPQVGPLFKQGFPDDVERWTTAFIPKSLDMMTPVEIPTDEDRWIRVDLSEQLVIAYEGEKPVRGFVVSSGLPRTPTVTGEFRIRTKVRSQTMTGGDPALGNYYNLPNVEWVQYFYEDYSFHGTYWHRNFGRPMSHGCLNMTIRDAKWLFDWAGPEWDGVTTWYGARPSNPGTLVIVTE